MILRYDAMTFEHGANVTRFFMAGVEEASLFPFMFIPIDIVGARYIELKSRAMMSIIQPQLLPLVYRLSPKNCRNNDCIICTNYYAPAICPKLTIDESP